VDWLVELAGADFLCGSVLVLVQLHVTGRVVFLRHSLRLLSLSLCLRPALDSLRSDLARLTTTIDLCGREEEKWAGWARSDVVAGGPTLADLEQPRKKDCECYIC
jgi:hypothetical protein